MNNKNYQTILVIALGFMVIGFFTKSEWPYYTAFGVGALALISPRIAELIVKAWFGLAKILGFINSRILLTLIYYLILLPFALLGKMTKNKSLNLHKQEDSYFTNRDHLYQKADFEKPW